MQPQHPLLKILSGADSISARLAMLVLGCAFGVVFLGLFALLELTGLSPVVIVGNEFLWVVFGFVMGILILLVLLWLVISQEVLQPLSFIQDTTEAEKRPSLGGVALTVRAMRDSIERTQAALDESHKNLQQIEKLAHVGKLAAGVAHSVRNPLTSVNLRLFSLSRGLDLTERQQEDFKVIADAVRHIDTILSNFLEFSRRPKLKLIPTDSSSFIKPSLQLLENRISAFPVKVELNLLSTPPSLFADPHQLHEAMLNILLNACEAMEYKGNIKVDERIKMAASGSIVEIVIEDSGPGITEKDKDSLFIPFFSTKDQGTGLGLPIAKGILEEHDGDIIVSSTEGAGSIFTLILPIKN